MRFTEVNVNLGEYNNKKISLFDNDKKVLKFQIPRMYIPFGLNGFTPEVGDTKWSIDFNLHNLDDESYIKRFYEFVRSIEEKVINYVQDNSEKIFGKVVDARSIFNSNIKSDKFRVKFDPDKTLVFDINNINVDKSPIGGLYQKHSGVGMVELGNVYFLNNMFGITWKLLQLKIYEPQRLKGFHFIDV